MMDFGMQAHMDAVNAHQNFVNQVNLDNHIRFTNWAMEQAQNAHQHFVNNGSCSVSSNRLSDDQVKEFLDLTLQKMHQARTSDDFFNLYKIVSDFHFDFDMSYEAEETIKMVKNKLWECVKIA